MNSDEREIFHYLQTLGRGIHQRQGNLPRASTKKRYHEDPDWAKPLLMGMAERGILESDAMGRFRVKPKPKKGHKATLGVARDRKNCSRKMASRVEDTEGGPSSDEHHDQL